MALWLIIGFFFGSNKEQNNQTDTMPIVVSTEDSWVTGQLVSFSVKNNTDAEIVLGEDKNPPENIYFQTVNPASKDYETIQIDREDDSETLLPVGATHSFTFSAWNNELFSTPGNYKVCVNYENQAYCDDFEIEQVGLFRSLWRVIFFKPIFNILVFFIMIFPGHSLALGILALTLLIKLLLLSPSKNALIQQQKMQKLQDEVNVVRKRHAGDQQKIAEETMAIWKKHKVNPLSSFWPMFIQMPVMIALFYVVKQGLMPHNQVYLWEPLKDFSLSLVSQNLFGILDLSQTGVLWLAIVVAALQFVSMKLITMMKTKGKNKKEEKKDKSKDKADANDQMQKASQVMMYMLPLMIGFFAYSTPAAVGFYWGISTIFTIGQQYYLNKHQH